MAARGRASPLPGSDGPAMEALRGWLVPVLLPERCFEELLLQLHVLHVPCLKILLSKALGYAIVGGSVLVKLPQVLKVWGGRSGAGLSPWAVGLELLALGGTVAYGTARGFPFSAWGESLFLLFQTLALLFLILHFRGHTARGVLLVAAFWVFLGALVSPRAPPAFVTALQAANLPISCGSRLLQALTNHRQRHTGQLSGLTVALLLGGAVARVFTSLQETGDALLASTFAASAACNALLMGQILYYRGGPPAPRAPKPTETPPPPPIQETPKKGPRRPGPPPRNRPGRLGPPMGKLQGTQASGPTPPKIKMFPPPNPVHYL